MTHEQKMHRDFPDYPCVHCPVKNKNICPFRDCERYRTWFSSQWGKFQEVVQQLQGTRELRKLCTEQEAEKEKAKKDVYFRKSDSTELSDVEKITRIIM